MSQQKESLLYKVMKVFVAGMMMLITALTFYQIVLRYGFNKAPSWSEELVRFVFVWLTFLAAGMGVRERIHIGIDVVVNMLPQSLQKAAGVAVALIIVAFGAFLLITGMEITEGTHLQASPALGLPMSYVYAAIPFMGVLMICFGLNNIRLIFKGGDNAPTMEVGEG
ncbi:Tripartite ATP-independent periplasmic transporter DctQ component [uncultured delta proteobacterium]|uniref:Tripartite ATP-independent periplasmic transporter DctQ component n=1 Tax=uncultured delta proteobacterium TaxID=34034 RepID=A0A212JDD2_9DELT|nr:Tripartite ATP-independent periplasmic transporter DctQ component [uncultured delta proteobacterium]